MKSMTKRTGTVIAVAALATAFAAAGTLLLKNDVPSASAEENAGINYFYGNLGADEKAKNFYNAFNKLYEDGVFKTGKLEYDLVANNVVLASEVADYVQTGSTRLPKAYGAGRDTFIMDHPDLFYVDLFGTSISAGSMGDNYVAYLDSSRVKSLYLGDLNSVEKVNAAIATYESKLNKIVADAKAAGDTKAQIEYVNEYLCNNTEYSFGTVVEGDRNVDTPAAAYVNTAYGSIVNGKAVCGGYSLAFKAVMDRLDIPCVCIQGYSLREDGSSEAHMWNAVKLEGAWYNVDVTWNDTGNDTSKWLFLGTQNFDYAHLQDAVISSSGYELRYPAIKPYDLGVNEDENNMTIDGEYSDSDDETGKILTLTVSYEGKGALKLQEEGKHLAFRFGDLQNGKVEWDPFWMDAIQANEVFAPFWTFEDTQSKIFIFANSRYVQFALIGRAPEENYGATYPESAGENAGKPFNYVYVEANLTEEDFVVKPSAPYENDGYNTYKAAPFAFSNVLNTGSLPVDATYEFTLTYTESLEKIDPSKGVGMTFTTSRGDYNVREHAVLTDFVWDGDKVISFKFTPSKMYIHNLANYDFVPTNLIGTESKKEPTPIRYSFKREEVICSKILGGGRLYMDIFGQAELLDTSDLSITDFKDENGKYYAESQRSQLMLVVSKPDENRAQEMKDVLLDETPIAQNDIVSSATYEIDLQICGIVPRVPNGTYMQVSFGFPEGYSPDDAGTTYKIYHYKHDDKGNITGIEEIPVIITEYGIIAKVESSSPFIVVQVKNTSAAVTESKPAVYASVFGNGTLTTDGKSGICVLDGNSITYTVKAEEGYQVSGVFLNGKVVEASKYANGTLTLSASELETSNTLEAHFVTKESAQSYAEKGIEVTPVSSTIGDVVEAPVEKPEEKPEEKPSESTEQKPEEKKKGCGSSIEYGAFGLAALAAVTLGVVVVAAKRKNND